MIVSELSQEECRELLTKVGFGRLACSRENQPYVVPIYFAFEPDCLYGFATMGQKIEWMRSNPLVCVEVDDVKSHVDWTSVVLQGRYEEFPDTPAHATQRQRAQGLLEKRGLWWQTALGAAQTRARFDRDNPVFYCLRIEKISGRRASSDPVEVSFGVAPTASD